MKKTINKSLSARIRRRNKQGFEGNGTNQTNIYNSHMGNYRNPIDNHKYDDRLDFKYNEEKGITEPVILPTAQQFEIARCKRIGFNGRHAGSKPVSRLSEHHMYQKPVSKTDKVINKLVKAIAE